MAAPKTDDQAASLSAEERHEQVDTAVRAQARTADYLRALAARPDRVPQVLILEGGATAQRAGMAFYWAALLNCREPGREANAPCLACHSCRQVLGLAHRDIFLLDGEAASIKIDDVRALRSVLGEPPRGDGFRVIILAEAQELTVEAANSLLKALEEPKPLTSFLLLAPQRERMLPTLVSRGWTITLSWQRGAQTLDTDPEVNDWQHLLLDFYRTGRGLFARTGARGAVDRALVRRIALAGQRQLATVLCGCATTPTARFWAEQLTPENIRRVDVALTESLDALDANVNAALVLDWLATRIHALAHDKRLR
ncbi:MAG: DNA polymerase III subunit delta' [Desulfovibrionaceae bacterium]